MPNRILRDFRDSPTMASLSDLEERMFVRMIMTADDFGLGLASNLHATCFPVADIPKDKSSLALANMARVGLIRLYRDASGRELFSIIKFGNKPRATSSKFYTWDECKHLACNLHTTCEQNHSECTSKPETGNRKPETEDRTPLQAPKTKRLKKEKSFTYTPEFESAWAAWPEGLKGTKGAAFAAWEKCPSRPPIESILASIAAHRAHSQSWQRGYAPHVATWINQRGFDTTFDPSKLEFVP